MIEDMIDGVTAPFSDAETAPTSAVRYTAAIYAFAGYCLGGFVTRKNVSKEYSLDAKNVAEKTTYLGLVPKI